MPYAKKIWHLAIVSSQKWEHIVARCYNFLMFLILSLLRLKLTLITLILFLKLSLSFSVLFLTLPLSYELIGSGSQCGSLLVWFGWLGVGHGSMVMDPMRLWVDGSGSWVWWGHGSDGVVGCGGNEFGCCCLWWLQVDLTIWLSWVRWFDYYFFSFFFLLWFVVVVDGCGCWLRMEFFFFGLWERERGRIKNTK